MQMLIAKEKMGSIVQNVPVPTGSQQVGAIKYDLIDTYGTVEERKVFFEELRKDIREFLKKYLVKTSSIEGSEK